MRVPREIDELMWAVAEQRNPETNEQFLERYPEFADELDQRVQMVHSLRGSRPSPSVERFVPREHVRNFGPSRLAVAGVAMLVLGSVTFAAYATMQYVNSKRSTPSVVEHTPEIIFNPPTIQTPGSTTTGGGALTTETEQTAQQGSVPPIREQETFNAFMGKVTIDSENISMEEAIQQIADSAGLRVVIAPGFEDKRIRIRFVNQPAIEILKRMGTAFGFTPLEQGKVEVLIIPTAAGKPAEGQAVPGSVGLPNPTGAKDGPEKATTNGGDPG
jgi:hypothetical protein